MTIHTKSQYPLLRLLRYISEYKKSYLTASLFSFLNKLFDVFPEILIGGAVDIVANGKHSWLSRLLNIESIDKQLYVLGALTFLIWAFESFFQYLYSLSWRSLAQTVEHKVRMDCYQHIQNAPLPIIEKNQTGQLISILNDDINQLERFLEDGFNQIIQITSSTILIGAVFLWCSPLITLFAILPVPFILIGAFYFQHKLEPRFLTVREKAAHIAAALSHNLLGMATIKSFTNEPQELRKIETLSHSYQSANEQTIKISAMVTPVIRIVILCGFMATLLIGGYQTLHGTMNVGIFSVLVFLSQRLLWPFSNLAEVTVNYQRAMASTTRALNLLTWPQEQFAINKDQPEPFKDLQFSNICFSYTDKPLFENFDLHIPANSTIAFVGESGSGKSTLIKLLCRFYEPNSGNILYDQQPISSLDLKSWRQNISLVSQEIYLFPGSLYDNVAYGTDNATEADVHQALKLAGAEAFVQALPEGLQSQIFESGANLSGGQRQRIIIARALLKSSPILIFDEATAAVDNDTELAIQKALHSLKDKRTVLLIAHRLSTVRHADYIYVMDNGKIIEQGSHSALLDKKGKYHRLWSIQTGEII